MGRRKLLSPAERKTLTKEEKDDLKHKREYELADQRWKALSRRKFKTSRTKPVPPKGKKQTNLLEKLRKYITEYDPAHNAYRGFVTKEGLAQKFNARVKDVEQCLHTLNLEGVVSLAHHSRDMDGEWRRDTYSVNRTDIPNNPITQKFGDSEIFCEFRKHDQAHADGMYHNFVRQTFGNEYNHIKNYQNFAERWDTFDQAKRSFILTTFVMPSRIICCHMLHECKTLTPKERKKILTRIHSNSECSLWTLFNCKLSKAEKMYLVASAGEKRDHWDELLENIDEPAARYEVLKFALEKKEKLYDAVYSIKKYFTDDDKLYLVKRLAELGDPYTAYQINGTVNFNMDQKDYIAHLVLAWQMCLR